ncbi:unnamed protein product [Sphenostylis stenocarpa]|uniref:Prolamin-like domain-containing protein n=1 Tax=Sphenostylis stenocarpa TaxID=92480 RepID=A0AA86TDN3_9FABA|nr:unnamed protein product [Sphenostylis stenocarpa]
MATFHSFCLMVVVMISVSLMLKTGLSYEVPAEPSPSPSDETDYAPRPLSSYEVYLQHCAAKLYPDCGDQVFSAIFFGNDTVSSTCCEKLVNEVGKRCHDDMTKYSLQSPNLRKNQFQILQRSESVWNYCLYLDHPALQPVHAPSIEPVGAESELFL